MGKESRKEWGNLGGQKSGTRSNTGMRIEQRKE